MATLNPKKLEQVLVSRLKLKNPEFRLDKTPGDRIFGSVISSTFVKRSSLQRQRMIWDALDKEFGQNSVRLVGGLLAYTPAEWNVDLEGFHKYKKKTHLKRAGVKSRISRQTTLKKRSGTTIL